MEEQNNEAGGEIALATPSAIGEIVKAEIDQQIATAHAYPRSMARFKNMAVAMATLDEETAASCIYKRPVGKKPNGQVEYAEGASVRAAEIVGACYGNLRVGAQLIEQTPRYVKARGYAHDLETNFASTSEVIESTVTSKGVPFSERMRLVIAKAAIAKARRDATFQVVPKALFRPIEAAARQVAMGNASTLSSRRAAVMQWIGKLGIDVTRVFRALGIKGEEDIGLEELVTLTGLKTSIKDGEVTVDEAFPDLKAIEAEPKQTVAERAAAAKQAAQEPTPPPQEAAAATPQPETAKPRQRAAKAAEQPAATSAPAQQATQQQAQPAAAGGLFGDAPQPECPKEWREAIDRVKQSGSAFEMDVLMDEAAEALGQTPELAVVRAYAGR